MPKCVLQGLDYFRQGIDDFVFGVEPSLHLWPEFAETVLKIFESLVMKLLIYYNLPSLYLRWDASSWLVLF